LSVLFLLIDVLCEGDDETIGGICDFAGSDNSVLLPQMQVGRERSEEMKLMYGEAAPMILGMETAMQLSFNRNCDLKQPKPWPNIPLKL
jgi:hypothetical protein